MQRMQRCYRGLEHILLKCASPGQETVWRAAESLWREKEDDWPDYPWVSSWVVALRNSATIRGRSRKVRRGCTGS
ncbi:hypothetical protein B0H13DRAFT_162892 [Mycena leptocephala]|nr:hypothetical protein B0H13DRAFT_162892 [Mycena leptocephala]